MTIIIAHSLVRLLISVTYYLAAVVLALEVVLPWGFPEGTRTAQLNKGTTNKLMDITTVNVHYTPPREIEVGQSYPTSAGCGIWYQWRWWNRRGWYIRLGLKTFPHTIGMTLWWHVHSDVYSDRQQPQALHHNLIEIMVHQSHPSYEIVSRQAPT